MVNAKQLTAVMSYLHIISFVFMFLFKLSVQLSAAIEQLIAFDERVTFWLQRVQSLPCACAYVALFARRLAYNHYANVHAYNEANAHAQKAVTGRVEAKKVTLSSKAIGV